LTKEAIIKSNQFIKEKQGNNKAKNRLTKKQASKNENASKTKELTQITLEKEVSITTTNSSKKRKRNETKQLLTTEASIKTNQYIKEKGKTNEN
jgi:hypothetical protein